MVLNFKFSSIVCLTLLAVGSVQATDIGQLTIIGKEVREISQEQLDQELIDTLYRKNIQIEGLPKNESINAHIETAGKVISVAKDLVALGEDIYTLVIKGKPTNTTTYAPISIIPKENGEPVDVMATENWQIPLKRTFEIVYVNVYGNKVVKFRYSVIFAYGGTYNGKGAYLTAVQIIPESVSTLFGYDFTATMKLGGIQNNGTRQNPVAGATLLMEYSVNTIMKAMTEVDTVFITGHGYFKKY
jgi:hypothetical protein